MQISQAQATAFIEQVQTWAIQQSDVQFLLLIGSRIRTQHPADEWSDIDFWLFTPEMEQYFTTPEWVAQFDKPEIIFWKGSSTHKEGLRVLYQGGLTVDFGIQHPQALIQAFHASPAMLYTIQATFQRGLQILVDKINAVESINTLLAFELTPNFPPGTELMTNLICDYWYHLLQVVKKLQRGEIWTAWQRITQNLAQHLLTMLEWHTQALQGDEVDTWFNGRYLEEWVDPSIQSELQGAFPHYEPDDIKRVIKAQMKLFRRVAKEATAALSYPYPTQADEAVTRLINPYLG